MSANKSVLVTGSSRGIGRAIALQLAKEGYTLVLHGRTDSEALDSVKQEVESLNATVRILAFDVSDREQTKQALLADIEDHGSYYGVILNAGITKDNAFPFMQDAEWDDYLGKISHRIGSMPTRGLALTKLALNASLDNSLPEQLEVEEKFQVQAGQHVRYRR